MVSLKIKGTRQEVMDMLQFLDSVDPKGRFQIEQHIEVQSYVKQQEGETMNMFIASLGVQTDENELLDAQNNHFVTQMLTGVYND
ncbi:DUF3911 family protein [Microbacteriaceae bacterium 4G12]